MERTVQVLKALAEPTRLRIVALCFAGGDLAVSEFVRILGQSQPRVSRHLKLLQDAGLLTRFREQHWVFYRIPEDPQTAQWVAELLTAIPNDDEIDLDRGGSMKSAWRARNYPKPMLKRKCRTG